MTDTLHQATCVAIEGRAMLIEGPPGSGKSSLALMLIDRGAGLIGDDGVCLKVEAGKLLASPPPHIAGLLEVRNLGLLPFPAQSGVAVSLVLRLDQTAERFIEAPETTSLCGIELPLVRLWPDSAALALKAELALAQYGIG